jgi:hypothetical protein
VRHLAGALGFLGDPRGDGLVASNISRNKPVRRACLLVKPGTCSTNVRRAQLALPQKNGARTAGLPPSAHRSGHRPTCVDSGCVLGLNRARIQDMPSPGPAPEPRYALHRPRRAPPRSPNRTDAATNPKDHTNPIITLRRS